MLRECSAWVASWLLPVHHHPLVHTRNWIACRYKIVEHGQVRFHRIRSILETLPMDSMLDHSTVHGLAPMPGLGITTGPRLIDRF
jgi:hypothetical protein